MAKVVIMGAGVAGHTVARYLGRWIAKDHEVVVVSPRTIWNWIPSNVWVGAGTMSKDKVVFDLPPIYDKLNVGFVHGKAVSVHPEGKADSNRPFVSVELMDGSGEAIELDYDYLVNATGPKLNFDATEGLGPDNGYTTSVCTADHAEHANHELQTMIEAMKRGEEKTVVIGTGHGMCTCQGAAFEYLFNVEQALKDAGVRDKASVVWISNEYEMGDFGMGSVSIESGGYLANSKTFVESLMRERGVHWITRAGVNKIEPGLIHYETLDGEQKTLTFDFSMLIPPFSGVGLKAFGSTGEDITDQLFAPNGFMKVDADYTPKAYEEWKASDWPRNYQNPTYTNIYAIGIAFAPPHAISKVMKSPNGTQISPTPPRTGMPSAGMGKAVAMTIRDQIKGKNILYSASMAETGAACVASTGVGLFGGSAATITVFPIVPDYEKYPETGRDLSLTFGEVGLAGHWMKTSLHYMFLHQAKLKPGWTLIPD